MPPTDDHDERRKSAVDIAVLKEQMSAMRSDMAAMKLVNADQSQKLNQILLQLSEAKGGWRTMVYFGSAAVSLGGLFSWLFTHFTGKP